MKNYLKTVIFLTLILFISCEKLDSTKPKKTNFQPKNFLSSTKDVTSSNGVLCFKSQTALNSTLQKLNSISELERENWEKSKNFTSQRSIFTKLIDEENYLDSISELKYRDTTISDKDIPSYDLHPDIYYTALKKEIIVLINKNTPEEYYTLPETTLGLIDILNEDGLYAIADTLYQIKGNILKKQCDYNQHNTNDLISTKESDPEKNISVVDYTIQQKSAPISNHAIDHKSGWVSAGGKKKGAKRIQIRMRYEITGFDTYNSSIDNKYVAKFAFEHSIQVECMERNWRRKWKHKNTKTWVNGSWDFHAFEYPYSLHKSSSWIFYPGNLTTSINLETGDRGNASTLFILTSKPLIDNEVIRQEGYPPLFDSYTWSATRYGGDHGLTATISK